MQYASYSKPNIPMRIAGALLVLVMISVYMMSGLYARYVTESEGGDSARVARFSVTEKLLKGETVIEGFDITFNPNSPASAYTIVIENNSEVSVRYTVTIENKTGNLPIVLDLDGEGPQIDDVLGPLDNGERSHTLSISWNDDPVLAENSFIYNGRVDHLTVTVTFEQID